MTKTLTLGVDIGTTNVKASILDTSTGKVIAHGSKDHPLFHPQAGYAEQEADNYWEAVVSCIRQCLEQGDFFRDIAGVALSGLVGVMLPVDKSGLPVRPAMIWMDARSEPECQDIRDTVGEARINHINGNRLAPWFIEPKILWMKKHEPENFERTHKFLSPAGYCTFKLTNEMTVNTGDAGLFYAYDYQRARWNESLANDLGIPSEKYADIFESHEVIGQITARAAAETGLPEGVCVVAGGTDISSAALGVGVTKAGQAFYSMGTGSNLGIIIPTEHRLEEFRILKWPHVLPGLTMFDAPMAFTGASLKWFRDQFAGPEMLVAPSTGVNEFDMICAQAENVPPGSHGLLYHPYLGTTLAPNWNSNAAGSFFGVRMTTTRSDFIRAVIEGVAFDVYSNVKIAQDAGANIDKLILNGGPTKSRLWNTITANVTNLPLEVPDIGEAAPLGDAILAAVGAGIYPDPISPLKDIVTIKETIEPDQKKHQMYEDLFGLWSSIYNSLKDDMTEHRRLINKHNLS